MLLNNDSSKPLNASDRSDAKAVENQEQDSQQKIFTNADILKEMMKKFRKFEIALTVFTVIILVMAHLVNNFGNLVNDGNGGFIKCKDRRAKAKAKS